MATEDPDAGEPQLEGETVEPGDRPPVRVGDYTWEDYLTDHGLDEAAELLYERFDAAPGSDRWGESDHELTVDDWARAGVDPAEHLGFHPDELPLRISVAADLAEETLDRASAIHDLDTTPVIKDVYSWEDYKKEYFYDADGTPPTGRGGEPEEFDGEAALGFDPDRIGEAIHGLSNRADALAETVDERTVDVNEELDEDAFFSNTDGSTTVTNRYDLEKSVPLSKKSHFREEDRYWVNKPYAFVVLFHSTKENEKKYYLIEPHRTEIEDELATFLTDKLRSAIKYDEEGTRAGDEEHRRSVIRERTHELLDRYDLFEEPDDGELSLGNRVARRFGIDPTDGVGAKFLHALGYEEAAGEEVRELEGLAARPEPNVVEEDEDTLSEYQVDKLLYFLTRDFIGYERIDGIKHDINVEDISCDGYNSPVFVYHSEHEQIISNVYHGTDELDEFVVKMAQRSGKGISKRRPQVDATLPDGSRAQLTLGQEVSAHGTNYTIRQFQEVPHTPIDLINWNTFSLDEMAFLWLCIENDKSLIFAGGTASGKTTSLNAISLFIPSNSKIVSIEDTREVELPQRNWIASVTRPSFSDDEGGDVDEFDLLEAALRQRPDYIVMGEIRGEEGRTLFQVMSTGHTTYTTFHADNVGEVLKRFTTEPINVSKTMFTALDLVSIQTATRVQGHKVRRNKSLTEINFYDAENDEINVQDVYQWQAETDDFLKMSESNTLEDIKFDRGWDQERLEDELFKRRVVLAYLIVNGLNTYTQVAATFQAFINDPDTILALMANEMLEDSLDDLREMESVLISTDPEKEELVPRPDPGEETRAECEEILAEAEERLWEDYLGETPGSVADALADVDFDADVEAEPEAAAEASALPEGSVPTDDGDDDDALESEDEPAALPGGEDPTPPDADGDDDVAVTGDATEDGSEAPSGPTAGDASVEASGDETGDGDEVSPDVDPLAGDDGEPAAATDDDVPVIGDPADDPDATGPTGDGETGGSVDLGDADEPEPGEGDGVGLGEDADLATGPTEDGDDGSGLSEDDDGSDLPGDDEVSATTTDDEGSEATADEEDDAGAAEDEIDDWGFGDVEDAEEET